MADYTSGETTMIPEMDNILLMIYIVELYLEYLLIHNDTEHEIIIIIMYLLLEAQYDFMNGHHLKMIIYGDEVDQM